jgi:hypothetical protein
MVSETESLLTNKMNGLKQPSKSVQRLVFTTITNYLVTMTLLDRVNNTSVQLSSVQYLQRELDPYNKSDHTSIGSSATAT